MNYLLSSFCFAVVQLFRTYEYEKLELLRDTLVDMVDGVYKTMLDYRKGQNE